MTDPHFWWYLSRVTALGAWSLMSFSVVWGVLLASRVFRGLDSPSWLKDLHKYLSTLTVLLASIHAAALTLDPYVKFDAADLFIPGVATYEGATATIEIALAIGVVSLWVMSTIYVTSLFMDKLPRNLWKGIHFTSYLIFFAIGIHAAFAGSDVGTWWYTAVSLFTIVMGMVALIIRLTVITLRDKKVARDAKIDEMRQTAKREREAKVLDNPDEDTREKRRMIVHAVTPLADDIMGIRLIPVGGERTAWWDAGSHITLHLPNGLERQYSLCGDPTDRAGYDIGVLNTRGDGGGSTWIHENIRAGSVITVSGPRNHFPLVPAKRYIFIAGGIGITPIRAMIEALPKGREWQLVYLGKNSAAMAFSAELQKKYGSRVVVHESERNGRFDLTSLLSAPGVDVMCCGPESLMAEVESTVPRGHAHVERFTPVERTQAGGPQPVEVVLAASGRTVSVPADVSIADALKSAGIPIETSCGRGVCGTCELRVIDGKPAHLDSVTSDDVKDQLGVFYPCVSRAETSELVVDA